MNFKAGIIGYGTMGKTRHQAIDEIDIAEVIAISEPAIGSEFKSIPNFTHEEILEHSEIDAIFICTPSFLNKKLTIEALNSGKHVFCEKPPAFTGADVLEIREVEVKSGKKLMYGFNHRHHDSVIRMKGLIDSGEYGKVLWTRGRYGKSVTEDYFNGGQRKKWQEGES